MSAKNEHGLTGKQEAFCHEYLVDFNASAAAKRAGYSERSARSTGHSLLKHPAVQARLKVLALERTKSVDASVELVLRELMNIATFDIADLYDEDGRLKPIHDIPEGARKAIAAVDAEELWEGRGESREHIGTLKKVKIWDKLRSLQMIGQHLGMFKDLIDLNVERKVAEFDSDDEIVAERARLKALLRGAAS